MSGDNQPPSVNKHDRAIATGAFVNVLGTLGKALIPVFFIVATRLYGPALVGVYFLAFRIIEVAVSLTVSGFNTGTLMYVSRHVDDSQKSDLVYRTLANGFVFSLVISGILILISRLGGLQLLPASYNQDHLLDSVQLLAGSLPLVVIPLMIIAATRARMMMKWDAIIQGFLRPALLIGFSTTFYFLGFGLDGLLWAYILAQAVMTLVSLVVFGRYFSYRRLFDHLRRFSPFVDMLKFAIPQNLNMTFNTFITNLDVLMLGLFSFAPEKILFYGMGAEIIRNIRQVKLAFSGSFTPVIARFHERKDRAGLSESYSTVTRWIITIGLPLALIVALLRQDLLLLFDSTFEGDTTFMLLLLVAPLLSCGTGLAGNIVVMTGHSTWNLFNSLFVGGANCVLNLILIPRYGMLGAAGATAIASAGISLLQMIEAQYLEGAHLIPRRIYKPYLAILPAVTAVVGLGLVVDFGGALSIRLGGALLGVVVFAGVLILLGVSSQDKAALKFWSDRKGQG